MMTADKHILPPSLVFKMQIAKFIVQKFSKQQDEKDSLLKTTWRCQRLAKIPVNKAWW